MALIKDGKKITLGTGYSSSAAPQAERAARALEASARAGASRANTAAPSAAGGTGEAWTRAAPSQTRVPAPKAVSDDGIWSRGSRYSGIGSNPVAVPSQPASSAATSRGRASQVDSGYSPGRERASRQYVSVPDTVKRDAPSVDYRDTASGGGYSAAKGFRDVLEKGMNRFAQAGADTLAMAEDILYLPFEVFSSSGGIGSHRENGEGLFYPLSQSIREKGDALAERSAENVRKGGRAAELFDRYGTAAVAAIPQAILAKLSLGASTAAQGTAGLTAAASSEMAPGVLNTVREAASRLGRDPQFWASFAQAAGPGYQQALDDGVSQDLATLYAVSNGLMNAAVEVGGGIQTLPAELRAGTSGWKALAGSMLDEAAEEPVQGVIERGLQNLVYQKGNPLFSLSDPNAVLNPFTATDEAIGGAVVGGILSGGQIAVGNVDAFLEGFLDGDTEPVQVGRGAVAKGPYPGEALALPQGGVVTGLADSGGGRLALEGGGGLPGVVDFGELYAAALQNGFVQPGTMRDWRAEVGVPALYWEYLRNFYGVQPAVPLLPEWSGGGREGLAEIEGSALVPMFQDAAETGQNGLELQGFPENKGILDSLKGAGYNEIAALDEEEEAALLDYKSSWSYRLNAALRDGDTLDQMQYRAMQALDRALEKLPVHQGPVYRRIGFDDIGGREALEAFLAAHQPGLFVYYPAFTSASTEPDGYLVEGELTVSLIIEGRTGRDVDGYGNNFEREVLFPRGSGFFVDRVENDADGKPIIYMREVIEDGIG